MLPLEQEPEQVNILPPTDNDDKRIQNKRKLLITMLDPLKELLVAVLVAVAYAALTNDSPTKISKTPAAYPFFSRDSVVTDWYRGEISRAIEQARISDLAFVMFYAPWDAQSQATRRQFELTAELMGDQVTFVAINCWQPGSECKSQYSKVYRWPVLIAYPTHGRGVQYNGPLTAPHMARFLRNVCKPLVLLRQSINELLSRSDAVVFAMINALPGSYDYSVFYLTALRYLEKDPFRDVSFAILPQSPEQERLLTLYLWNETKVYMGDNWNTDTLLSWINRNLHQITTWLSPTGMKSLTLSNFVQTGSALLLFTPRNPFFEQTDYYNMLKEMAYEYYNCDNDELKIKQKLVQLNRYKNYINYQEMKQKCSILPKNPNLLQTKTWINTTNCQNCCECKQCSKYKTSMSFELNDNLIRFYNDEKCRNLHNGDNFHLNIFQKKFLNDFQFNISGLHCSYNDSLVFVAMDSLEYYHFAEKLGIDLAHRKHKTAMALMSNVAESHYIMNEDINELNVRQFVYNFTKNSLNRALNSSNLIKSKNTHSFPLMRKCPKQFCIKELHSDNFQSEITELNKAVIVFYYSKQCAFCSGIAHVFLTTANLLKTVENIKFARIDGDLNLLPWEYTMEKFPTFLFFPPNKKSESRVFPRSLSVTVPNLIGFILTNLEPNLKLKAMWSICNQTKFSDEKLKCTSSIRTEILSVTELTLKRWRIVDNRRKARVLHKLQMLRQLHLLLAHSPERVKLIDNYLNKFNENGFRFKDEL